MSKSLATGGLQLALLLSLSGPCLMLSAPAPALAEPGDSAGAPAGESPESFLQRYLNAVHTANSPFQLLGYMVPRDKAPFPPAQSEEEKKMMAKMLEAVMVMQRGSTPRKVEIQDKQDLGDKVIFKLKATEMDANAGIDLHAAGASVTGKLVLQKGPGGWLIANGFWHSNNGAGLTTDTGKDPDAPPVAASVIDKYTDDIMAAVGKIWTEPAPGSGQVTIELKNTASGHFEMLGVKDKQGRKEAEELVKSALNSIVLPPLPAEVSEQSIVNIQLGWSPRYKDTVKVVQLLNSPTVK